MKFLAAAAPIARHADAGDQVQVLIVAEGATSRQNQRDPIQARDELSALAQASQTAGLILGAAGVELLDLPDNRLDSLDRLDLIKRIEVIIDATSPRWSMSIILVTWNVDHRRLHEAVVTACRLLLAIPLGACSVLRWPVAPSGNHRDLHLFFSRTGSLTFDQWQRKREALEAYASEMRPSPHARSLEAVEHLARWRGAQVGVEATEAFFLLRQLR